jgi:D-beta-D-heptose 7-phosphate kinase/D-beta-D-heptose 1-phosphate adenosyltransferase
MFSWEEKNTRVLVIGDLILDEYLDGIVNRISPEAPVPIHLVKKAELTAGGAANVARNISLIGGVTLLSGVCGNDYASKELKKILEDDLVDISLIKTDETRPTIKKTRITSSHQQLVRIDWEKVVPIADKIQKSILSDMDSLDYDVILLSDYGKGALPENFIRAIIKKAQGLNTPVVVDPKGKSYDKYRGAHLVTPNRKEACEAVGLDESADIIPEQVAREICSKYGIKNALVTLGSKGMFGFGEDESEGFSLSAVKREVFDVSGAGDTVVSVMALAIGAGESLRKAMELANLSAGCVVEKWGTQPILKEELVKAVSKCSKSLSKFNSENKILSVDDLSRQLKANKKMGKLVFTNGCFDILHGGHLSYLEKARSMGDALVIAVNSDDSVKRLKGETRPIIPAEYRKRMLAGLACVDYVVEFAEDTPLNVIEKLTPNVLVKGADYHIKDIVGADHVIAAGGEVETIDFVDGWSTSKIIEKIKLED